MKRCIFHIPMLISNTSTSASSIRPFKMIKAFETIGYDVDIIIGYGKDRKNKIKQIKRNMKNGIKYDFLYSESSTMPTLLTEKKHIPLYPFLDFRFFKFCKKNNLKIGLFYRDIYWKFDIYKEGIKKWIPFITIPFYKYDLKKYEKLVDLLYTPSDEFAKYVEVQIHTKALPSGGDYINDKYFSYKDKKNLELIYVGGISYSNNIRGLLEAINPLKDVNLTICCNEQEWKNYKESYFDVLTNRVKVVHVRNEELRQYYKNADIACLYYENSSYSHIAMPTKLFDYIGNCMPIISNNGKLAAEFIEENNIGWVINYEKNDLIDLLKYLLKHKNEIKKKSLNVSKIAKQNTWIKRAEEVAKDLS